MTEADKNQAISADDEQAVARLGDARDLITAEIGKAIIGMEPVIDEMMITIFARGHTLLVGVPGLAKTLLVSSLAQTMSLDFKRIQFTPDLMPSDITGTELLPDDPVTNQRVFKFTPGPVFAHLILATVAANVDHAESDVKVMEPEEMESAMSSLPVRVIDGDRNVAGVVMQARTGRELWLWMLGTAAVLMVMEAIFARWSTKHGS